MVAGDVSSEQIRHIHRKARKCKNQGCYDLIYKDEENKKAVAPRLYKNDSIEEYLKTELWYLLDEINDPFCIIYLRIYQVTGLWWRIQGVPKNSLDFIMLSPTEIY